MKDLRILLTIFIIACPRILWADIYRYVDEEGVVHYSNAPNDRKYELYLRAGPRESPPGAPGASLDWTSEYVERFARANNLSPALIKAIIKAESSGNRMAVSPKGAQGMMQLMPLTSKHFNVSDPFDPIENIEGGVRYFKELLDTFQGNVVHALAAYNAGPTAVRRHGGIPPYRETQEYVKRVMKYYRQYLARNE
jgi:soluble lytic murein transglycosylase-like protein